MQFLGQQKRTFLPYERGILPEDLRLGSLYINPLDPTDGLDSTRFEYRDDIEDQEEYESHIRQWTRKEEKDVPFSIEFEKSQVASANISFTHWMKAGKNRDQSTHVTLEGASGRRMKIKRPESFLREVFKQPQLEQWLRMHASVTYRSKHSTHGEWKAPELWLVTGVQYVTGGAFHFEGNFSTATSAGAGADLGALAGGPPGVLKVKADASRERSNGAQNDFGHEDERVWAAQFMPVKIEYGRFADPELSVRKNIIPKTILQIRLDDVPDLAPQGFRTGYEYSEEASSPPPELIGRVVAEFGDDKDEAEDDGDSDDEGLVIDDRPYVDAIRDANWKQYEHGIEYLRKQKQRRNNIGRQES
ncbi:hypothetical protein CC80DRAFT_52932 [Byssothecium circinans]|uniref:Uncharacterized protein n=1 Tax=Byssothecium circinans TaxID=147558 RepID=A0A6A5U781_9PLEO|nr:hypothetical protein CC80DRAFT_52932 [Byssothecium circinans]